MNFKKLLFSFLLLMLTTVGWGQIVAWDFYGESSPVTSTADVYNTSLDASNLITRGSGAAASAASNSFRTVGFQNNGISTSNTDYFQITLSASTGYTLSLSTIDAKFAGTATFAANPGVSNQFAYSLDGTNFTLIGSPQILIGSPVTLTQINLTGIVALQNLPASTTVTIRYYASGQTTTGGWGFNSPSNGAYGLAIGGTITSTSTSHTVIFNANGGSGTMSDQTASSSTALTLNTYTRTGYTFNGWNTVADGSGTSYADGATYNFSTDITLYAQWVALTPTITTSTTSLTGFTYVEGSGPSAEQSFTVSGTNLTADISVTPPTNWEISTTSGGPYQTSAITLTQSGGVVGTTSIYTRMVSGLLNVNSPFSGNIACASTGATTKNVAVSGTVTAPNITTDWCNVQWPNTTQTIAEGSSFSVYAQAYKSGLTEAAGQATGLSGWIGYSSTNDNPANAGWTWIPATFNVQSGNNDEFVASLGSGLTPGTYYYASRFQINTGSYTYGGSSGIWNNDNVTLIVTSNLVDWCNLQYPASGSITQGGNFVAYARVYEPGVTDAVGQGAGISAWIGYSTTNNNPNSVGWTWVAASYNSDATNNDEYQANIGPSLAVGTYYYASRFQKSGSTEYTYGGYNASGGGFWDGTSNVNGVLTVNAATCSQLLISEYGEGASGNEKYIEIYNPTNSPVNLANYQIWLVSNGGTWPESTYTLSGSLIAYDVVVIANNSTDVPGADLYTTGVMSFNGDDAVGLAYNGGSGSTFSLIDAVGTDGADPGTGWSVAGTTNATVDHTLKRKSTVQSPNTNWSTSAGTSTSDSEWEVLSYSTTNMGSHESDCDTSPKMTVSPTSLSGFTYTVGTGPSAEQTFTVSGVYLTDDITLYAPTDYEISTTSGSGFGSSVTLSPSGGTVSTTTIYVRLKAGLLVGSYNGETATAVSTGATNKTVSLNGTVTEPVISVPISSLSYFTYVVTNGPSPEQSFTVSGTNLVADIVLTAPADYEISLTSGSGFTTTLNLTPVSNTVTATTIYIRLKAGLSIGTYNGEILTANSTYATQQTVTLNGTVTGSAESDIVTAGGESATVSSLENDATITTTADGVQVWQFTIRDGGADLTDGDSLPTILTGITFTQNAGNQMNDWGDAILACALFDGTTLISNTPIITTNQIQFSGLSFSVADGTSKTLSLRISIQTSPNDSGSNNDGDDFVFNITNTYVTADASGSQFSNFASTNSTNELNVFEVIATQLSFSVQPTDVGVGSVMSPSPTVIATDANGNIDLDYTGSISVSSTGTATVTIPVTAIAGISIFTDLIHTATGTGLTLTATASGLTSATSNPFDVLTQTILAPGDLAILAVNTNIGTSGEDQIAFVCFKDLSPGTKIYLTDNGYEREYAGEWGGTEGVISITRTGSVLPKGTIIVFQSTTSNVTLSSHYDIYTCGVADTNWTKSGSPGSGFNLNSDDDVWIMQGGTWTNDTSHHSTYDGNVLYGWTESGWDTGVGTIGDPNGTKWSALYPGANCFTTIAPVGVGKVKFNDPDINGDFTSTTNARLDWIALINTTSNWDTYTDNTTYNAGGYDYKGNSDCPQMTIVTGTYVDGVWTGRADENWFNCENWETFVVPDETVNVTIPGTASHEAIIDHLATNSDFYGDLAKTKNMTIEGGIWVEANTSSDILEVHGDLTIENNGQLDLNGTTDGGVLKLYGNWTNNYDEVNGFDETNSTVHFVGAAAQTVTCNGGVEHFYNVVLNNPTGFTTDSFNSDLYAAGSLTMTQGNLTVKSGHYALAGKDLTVGIGTTLTVENEGSLVQTDDSGIVTNNGTTIVHRTTSPYIQYDYTYFSSPIVNETVTDALSPFSPLYYLDAGNYNDLFSQSATGGTGFPQTQGTPDGFDDTGDDWQTATGFMTPGMGYIGRGNTARPSGQAVTFTATGADGRLNNGVVTLTLEKDAFDATVGSPTTAQLNSNNNANLIGNPYPSALSLEELHSDNSSLLTGTYFFWTHNTAISTGNSGPWLYNYNTNDFATYNVNGTPAGTVASTTGYNNDAPTGYVGTGQGFIAEVQESATDMTLTFNNSQRGVPNGSNYNNNQFYRQSQTGSLDRIWLHFTAADGEPFQTFVGFEQGASDAYDVYDSQRMENGHANDFYSIPSLEFPLRLAIQRLEPFTEDKVIPLGMELVSTGTCYISIDHVEGVFTEGQRVYLEDKSLNIIHDLSLGAYTFTQTSGDNINNRFVLRFNTNALATDEHLLQNLTFYPNPSTGVFYINYTGAETLEIEVFDMLGKKVLQQANTKAIDLSAFNSGIYLAKFTTPSGSITKKLVRE